MGNLLCGQAGARDRALPLEIPQRWALTIHSPVYSAAEAAGQTDRLDASWRPVGGLLARGVAMKANTTVGASWTAKLGGRKRSLAIRNTPPLLTPTASTIRTSRGMLKNEALMQDRNLTATQPSFPALSIDGPKANAL